MTRAVLGNKDDLPHVLPRLDQLMRVAGSLQRERRSDQRLHRARRPQLEELADRLADMVPGSRLLSEALDPALAAARLALTPE